MKVLGYQKRMGITDNEYFMRSNGRFEYEHIPTQKNKFGIQKPIDNEKNEKIIADLTKKISGLMENIES